MKKVKDCVGTMHEDWGLKASLESLHWQPTSWLLEDEWISREYSILIMILEMMHFHLISLLMMLILMLLNHLKIDLKMDLIIDLKIDLKIDWMIDLKHP